MEEDLIMSEGFRRALATFEEALAALTQSRRLVAISKHCASVTADQVIELRVMFVSICLHCGHPEWISEMRQPAPEVYMRQVELAYEDLN